MSTSTRPTGLPRDYAILLDTCSEPCLPFSLTLPPISLLSASKPAFIQPLRTPPLSPQISKTTPPPSTASIPSFPSKSVKNKIRCVHPNCTQTFQYPSQLKSHSVVHTKDRSFRCTVPSCNAVYTTNNRLKIHARKHSGERPYKCTQCSYSAVQKCTLDSHMVTMHTSETAKSAWRMERLSRAVPCGVCAKMFKTRASLESHAWRFHGAAPTVKETQD
ncbi:hypothetical protein HDU81_003057 [Chytriomyces hyalinus]|nr:hypothetical protein HDU81_003057 [Chytriomyces hyalinus]